MVDNQKDPWTLTGKFPKASEISDAYLKECESAVRDHCKEMMKPLGAVPAGLVSVIAGVLVGSGFPYWFQGALCDLVSMVPCSEWQLLLVCFFASGWNFCGFYRGPIQSWRERASGD